MTKIYQRLLLCLLLLISTSLLAQQEPLNTMYMYNGISINPAYAGTRDALSVTVFNRQQWVGMSGAPTTSSISAHMPVRFTNLSFGMSLVSDDIGPVSDIYANVFGAYKIKIGDNYKLSFGMSFGLYSYRATLSELDPGDGEADGSIDDYNTLNPNGGAGAYFYGEKFYIGLASPKLFESNLSNLRPDAAELHRHYYLSAGYVFHLSDRFVLKPSVLSKYVRGAPWTQDFNAELFVDDRFSVGVSYRINNSVAFMGGFHFNEKFMLGYSYGISTSSLNSYNDGSHEIVLTYDLRMVKSVVRSPRYYF